MGGAARPSSGMSAGKGGIREPKYGGGDHSVGSRELAGPQSKGVMACMILGYWGLESLPPDSTLPINSILF